MGGLVRCFSGRPVCGGVASTLLVVSSTGYRNINDLHTRTLGIIGLSLGIIQSVMSVVRPSNSRLELWFVIATKTKLVYLFHFSYRVEAKFIGFNYSRLEI